MINKINKIRGKWIEFWNQDTDTILYKIMCIVTIPMIIIGIGYIWFVHERLPKGISACMMQIITGLYCPGCGGTRAFMALLRGDVLKALYYHPAAVYGVGLYVTYFASQTLMRISKGKIRGMVLKPVYLYVMLGIVILNFVVRNVLLFGFGIATL